jgi:hypothetical protein
MKKIILGLCLITSTVIVFAGAPRPKMIVPGSVRESFHRDYPEASASNWKMVNGKWETSFRKMDDHRMVTACYNGKGHRIDSRMGIAQNAVPDKVMHRLNERYPGSYRHDFTKIDRARKGDLYAVKVRKQGVYRTLYMDKKGHERDYASR